MAYERISVQPGRTKTRPGRTRQNGKQRTETPGRSETMWLCRSSDGVTKVYVIQVVHLVSCNGSQAKHTTRPPSPRHAGENIRLKKDFAEMQRSILCIHFFFASTSTAAIGKWSITNAMQRNVTDGQVQGNKCNKNSRIPVGATHQRNHCDAFY